MADVATDAITNANQALQDSIDRLRIEAALRNAASASQTNTSALLDPTQAGTGYDPNTDTVGGSGDYFRGDVGDRNYQTNFDQNQDPFTTRFNPPTLPDQPQVPQRFAGPPPSTPAQAQQFGGPPPSTPAQGQQFSGPPDSLPSQFRRFGPPTETGASWASWANRPDSDYAPRADIVGLGDEADVNEILGTPPVRRAQMVGPGTADVGLGDEADVQEVLNSAIAQRQGSPEVRRAALVGQGTVGQFSGGTSDFAQTFPGATSTQEQAQAPPGRINLGKLPAGQTQQAPPAAAPQPGIKKKINWRSRNPLAASVGYLSPTSSA